jgi:hypothetical protein
MNEQILINVTPFETRVAIVEQGTVQEIQLERSNQRGNVGNIYFTNKIEFYVVAGTNNHLINERYDHQQYRETA